MEKSDYVAALKILATRQGELDKLAVVVEYAADYPKEFVESFENTKLDYLNKGVDPVDDVYQSQPSSGYLPQKNEWELSLWQRQFICYLVANKKVEAIKMVRHESGLGLKEAKHYVDMLIQEIQL